MPKAIRIQQQGGPEVLKWEDVQVGDPGPGEARVRHKACGLNFLDVYQRSGLYKLALPSGMGNEAAGIVEAVGAGVSHVKAGDRVAYSGGAPGAYSEARVMPAERLLVLPEKISFETAAAMMLKGMTAQYLLRQTYKVQPGDTVLLHAAAGGVGLLLCQWLKAIGAKLIGTAGSEDKAALARKNGCEHTILYRTEDVAKRVKEITNGRGVDVVYDSVGKSTFMGSLDSLRPRGMMVTYGNASGAVEPIAPLLLLQKGSLFLTRPTIAHYYATREESEEGVAALFQMVSSGKVRPHVGARYALREAARAHIDLEARNTVGSTVLTV
jgi:NADPH2:quinone reductase